MDLTGDFGPVAAAPSLSDAVSEGIRNRPEMHLALDNEGGARAKLEAAERDNRPTIAAHASGILADNSLPVLYTNRGYVSAGVSVSVPLWTSGRTEGDRLTARSQLRSAQSHEKLITQQIVDDVESALADLKAAQARLENADTLVAQAEEALALAKTRYTNGVITNFELLDAQSSAHSAELTRLQAHYDCVLASYALARASGRSPSA